MLKDKNLAIVLGIFGVIALIIGFFLVERYNISTEYASKVATESQNVKLCHNDCRYVSAQVAFLLHLGLVLMAGGGLVTAFLMANLRKH